MQKIHYGNLMMRALHNLIGEALAQVARDGLPGDHHFCITFRTGDDGVKVPGPLRARYPDRMTIVLQHWFKNLVVNQDGFSVTLNFGDTPQRLHIPYAAITNFTDPSVQFGFSLEARVADTDDDAQDADTHEGADPPSGGAAFESPSRPYRQQSKAKTATGNAKKASAGKKDRTDSHATPAEVVSLDRFRK